MGSYSTTMSTLARSYVRFLQQAKTTSLGQVRNMSAGHDPDGWKMWKKAFIFAAIPVIVLGHVNAFGMVMGQSMNLLHLSPMTIFVSELRLFLGVMGITPLSTILIPMPCLRAMSMIIKGLDSTESS